MAVTLQEIADKIGVSKMTVSRVLNGKSRGQVSSVLAEKMIISPIRMQETCGHCEIPYRRQQPEKQ